MGSGVYATRPAARLVTPFFELRRAADLSHYAIVGPRVMESAETDAQMAGLEIPFVGEARRAQIRHVLRLSGPGGSVPWLHQVLRRVVVTAPPLAGRSRFGSELLVAWHQEHRDGYRDAVGSPGSGSTPLALRVRARGASDSPSLAADPVWLAVAAIVERTGTEPGAFLDALGLSAEHAEASEHEATILAFARSAGRSRALHDATPRTFGELLPHMTRLGLDEPPVDAIRLAHALAALLCQLAIQRPILVVFDDFESASPSATELWEALAQLGADAPLTAVALCMDVGLGCAVEADSVVPLEPLAADEQRALLLQHLEPTHALPDDILDQVCAVAAGRPGGLERAARRVVHERLRKGQTEDESWLGRWSRTFPPAPSRRA